MTASLSPALVSIPDSKTLEFWRNILKDKPAKEQYDIILKIGRHNLSSEDELLLWQELAFTLIFRG